MAIVILVPIPVPIPTPMPRFQCRGSQMANLFISLIELKNIPQKHPVKK